MNIRQNTSELLRTTKDVHTAFLMGWWAAARDHWLAEARQTIECTELRKTHIAFARNNHREFLKQRRLLKRAV